MNDFCQAQTQFRDNKTVWHMAGTERQRKLLLQYIRHKKFKQTNQHTNTKLIKRSGHTHPWVWVCVS